MGNKNKGNEEVTWDVTFTAPSSKPHQVDHFGYSIGNLYHLKLLDELRQGKSLQKIFVLTQNRTQPIEPLEVIGQVKARHTFVENPYRSRIEPKTTWPIRLDTTELLSSMVR